MTASIHGWTGSALVGNNATFACLAKRTVPSAAPPSQIKMQPKSGVKAHALAHEDEIVALAGSKALKDARFVGTRYSEMNGNSPRTERSWQLGSLPFPSFRFP